MTPTSLASLAGLLADRTRACICLALVDGRAWTIGELARHAGIASSTASEHVARLENGGLVRTVRQGRHCYVRLAGPRVADLIEDLQAYAAAAGTAMGAGAEAGGAEANVRSLRGAGAAAAMVRARTCYDHLAGRLGVRLADAMTGMGLLNQASGLAVTEAGLAWLGTHLGIDAATLCAAPRPVARLCVDWTERLPHLGGGAGAAICDRFFALGWIVRIGTGRAVQVSPTGRLELQNLCGLDPLAYTGEASG